MNIVRNENRAMIAPHLAGWTRSRRDYQRGLAALLDSGLVINEGTAGFVLPTLFGPCDKVSIVPGWVKD